MATIINPITTVLLNREELQGGEFDRFPFKYILEDDGTISYFSKLNAGRYILSHEAAIPGLGKNRQNKAPIAEIQPLAHNYLVPGEMFYQIKQFFLDVMDMGPSTYEAQVFIVWNEKDEEYRIIVPKQQVSAAAVRYDIGDMLGDGDVIIVDIHSHNNMGAFFSATDNKDDKKNPWISGVFGKLSSNMEYKFRFNDGAGRHFDMKVEDIFDFGTEHTTPREWLDQVEISTYTPVKNPSTGVRSWESSYGEPRFGGQGRVGGWTAPNEGDMGAADDWLAGYLDPEGDLYDTIVDALHDCTNDEARAVLEAAETSLDQTDYAPTLTDRELTAFVEVHYHITNAEDKLIARNVLGQLRKVY